jgi:hypothetical protein
MDSGTIHLVYHDTAILIYLSYGSIIVRTDGWSTASTMRRINAFTPPDIRLGASRFTWLWHWQPSTKATWTQGRLDGDPVPHRVDQTFSLFHDGDVLWETSGYYPLLPDPNTARVLKANRRMLNRIRNYVDAPGNELESAPYWTSGMVPVECGLCVPTDSYYRKTYDGQVTLIGDELNDTTHLLDHILNVQYPLQLVKACGSNPASLRRMLRERLLVGVNTR